MTRRRALLVGGSVLALTAVAVTAAAIATSRAQAVHDPSMHPIAAATAPVVRTDLVATSSADGTLGYAQIAPITNRLQGTYTAVPPVGQVVAVGASLFEVDAAPVVLMAGQTPAYRPFAAGMTDGPDVAELEANLVALGDDPGHQVRVDDHFDWATTAAIERCQRRLGLPASGTLELGRIVFADAPIRVGAHHREVGEPASLESPYDATSTRRVVTLTLDATRQSQVPVGAHVSIDLLDGHHTTGTITAVAPLPAGSQSGTDTNGATPPSSSVAVTIGVAPGSVGATSGDLDGAPVVVSLATASARSVLAVPVTALLALAEGGYGVELVRPGGVHQLVAVTTGLFAQSLVEVHGAALRAGERVVTAQ